MDLKINITQKISLSHFEEIIVSALEGGSNYWYMLESPEYWNDLSGEEGEPESTRIAKSLFENPDFKMNVYDIEDDGEGDPLGTVTQASMLGALSYAQQEYPHVYHDLMEGQGDANTADVLFQLAVMGEVVFR